MDNSLSVQSFVRYVYVYTKFYPLVPSVVRKEGQGGMPCYAKSTPLEDTRSTEYFVPWQRTKCEGEKGGGVGGKNPSDFRQSRWRPLPLPKGIILSLSKDIPPCPFPLLCRHF